MLEELKRQGARGPILGTITMAGEYYNSLFAEQPEERQTPGFFTEGVYALAPAVFDSGNAETLAFADRFRDRFGREPTLYQAHGYEAARLAIAAVRATASIKDAGDLKTRRAAFRAYLVSFDSPTNGVPGLSGPMWFTPERGRPQAIRMGRFQGGKFVSAPGQLVPVRNADPSEIKSGAIVEIAPGRFVRHQQVVFTGIFLNEISRMDVAQSTFTADFYLWMRYARTSEALGVDPDRNQVSDLGARQLRRPSPGGFTLCLLCIVAVLLAERLRGSGRQSAALAVERSGRHLFAAGVAAIVVAGWVAYVEW